MTRSEEQAMARILRGIGHELSNVLTYVLPTLAEVACLHRALLELVSSAEGPLCDLAAAFPRADIERMDRQLSLGGRRLSQIFTDLRLGHAGTSPERMVPTDLREAMSAAVARAEGPPPVDLAPGQGGPVVPGDPGLLPEGLYRLVRAAVGWGRAAEITVPVEASIGEASGVEGHGGRQVARVRLLIPGAAEALPAPESLLDMLCPSESGALRAERGPLGVLVAVHAFAIHGGGVRAERERDGVALIGELPLYQGGGPR